jgi:hypothetical protein
LLGDAFFEFQCFAAGCFVRMPTRRAPGSDGRPFIVSKVFPRSGGVHHLSYFGIAPRRRATVRMASHVLNSAVLARPLAATRATRASRVAARCDPREDGVIVPNVRVAGVLAGAALALLPAAPALAAGKQPIDWLLEETVTGASSLGGIVKDSLAESGIATKEAPAPGFTSDDESASSETESGGDGIDVGSTALKFGKLGAILVFADVVTFAVMGRSVLGIMDDGGEEGWKEKMADKITERVVEKQKRADAEAGVQSSEPNDE